MLLPPSVLGLLPEVDLPDLRTLIVAGEACPASLVSQWARGRRFFNAYGPTETTVWASTALCSADGTPPSIGWPIANTRLFVLDEQMQVLPAGVPGELYIAGPGVALGYLNRPDLTLEHFVPNPYGDEDDGVLYKTGDLVRLRPDGEVEFLGRRDHQIKIRGYRIDTGEVREVLRRIRPSRTPWSSPRPWRDATRRPSWDTSPVPSLEIVPSRRSGRSSASGCRITWFPRRWSRCRPYHSPPTARWIARPCRR